MKHWLWVAVILLVLAVILTGGSYWFFSRPKIISGPLAKAKVVSWQPENRLLTAKLENNRPVKIRIFPQSLAIIIPVSLPGEPLDETLVRATIGHWWEKAFCQNDQVELTARNLDWNKIKKNQQIEIEQIRNKGPRLCR